LKASKEKLKQARDLLRGIPDGRGSLYSKAQAELTQVRSQLETIEQKIAAEESTTQTWAEADKLAQDAIASVQDPPHPLKTWRAAQTQLGQAIQQLEAIPEGTFVSRQVKTKLAAYRKQDTAINQGMMAEEKAVQTLQAADGLAKQAYDVTSGEYDFELSDLQAAQVAWQKAIAQLKKVPAKSHAYKDVASRMTLYSNNSREIADGIKELKTCSAKNSFSCGYVSLDLRTPTKSSTSSDEFDDSSNFSDSYSSDELTNENY
jgi:chromosome segregation ATPase